ncbi:MAG: hypothetical protein WC933_03165 [Candidatus Paceibacterota bacterium]|jgi:hypothetical protein
MSNRNHIIKSFKVSEETSKLFDKASEKTGLKKSELSRLLFNRSLQQLNSKAIEVGWDNINFCVKELK